MQTTQKQATWLSEDVKDWLVLAAVLGSMLLVSLGVVMLFATAYASNGQGF